MPTQTVNLVQNQTELSIVIGLPDWILIHLGPLFKLIRSNTVVMGLDDKKTIVAEIREAATRALSVVVADSRGVTVSDMTRLRKQARENDVYLRVVRNTLAKRAVVGTEYDCLQEVLVGPSLIAFSNVHPGTGARLFKEFAKSNDRFEVKALAFAGNLMGSDQLDVLATLPTYDEAIARLMSVMQGATSKLVRTLAAIRDQKEQQAS
jgi:large subunit ribosomal protein L10